MKKTVSFLRLFVTIFALTLINSCAIDAQNVLEPTAFEAKIGTANVQLVDVRTPQEFANGHLSNAKNINFMAADFKQNIALLDKSKPIAIYCGVGGRSGKASKILIELGFKDISDLAGGMTAWATARKKVVK